MGRPSNELLAARTARARDRLRVVSEGLVEGANPVPCQPVDLDEVADKKRLYCRYYGRCVTHAAVYNWSAFSCESCGVREVLTKEEQVRDLEGLTLFLHALGLKP